MVKWMNQVIEKNLTRLFDFQWLNPYHKKAKKKLLRMLTADIQEIRLFLLISYNEYDCTNRPL